MESTSQVGSIYPSVRSSRRDPVGRRPAGSNVRLTFSQVASLEVSRTYLLPEMKISILKEILGDMTCVLFKKNFNPEEIKMLYSSFQTGRSFIIICFFGRYPQANTGTRRQNQRYAKKSKQRNWKDFN